MKLTLINTNLRRYTFDCPKIKEWVESRAKGKVLNLFAGAGSTMIACKELNRNFIGIEKEEEYVKIAEARIKPYLEQEKLKW